MFVRHQFLLLLILKILGCQSLSLVAEYAARGIRGQVGFLQHGDEEVEVSANLKGAVKGEVFVWKIYQRPVLPYEPCTPAYYGEEVLDLSEDHGLLVVDSRITVGDLPLGELLERTLVLKSLTTLRVVCGVLRADVPVSTYGAKFISAVVGTLWFRQAVSHDGVWTGVRASLVSGQKDIKAPIHITWTLFSRAYESEDLSLEHMREGCRGLGRYPGRVVHEALLPLQLGDLEHKGRSYEIEHLPDLRKLVVRRSVWMVVYDTSGTMLACARLFPVRPRRATVKITSPNNIEKGGIGGYIKVYQASPLDPVKLSINLTLPRSDAQAFGIDNFPAGQKSD